MPDWLTHVLFAYVASRAPGLVFKPLDRADTALVLIGALLPDLTKVRLAFELMGMDVRDLIEPLHTPAGSLLVAALISLFFFNSSRTFLLLAFGAGTHCFLDVIEGPVGGGIRLLFPLNWTVYSLDLMPSDDWRTGAILLAVILSWAMVLWIFRRLAAILQKTSNH